MPIHLFRRKRPRTLTEDPSELWDVSAGWTGERKGASPEGWQKEELGGGWTRYRDPTKQQAEYAPARARTAFEEGLPAADPATGKVYPWGKEGEGVVTWPQFAERVLDPEFYSMGEGKGTRLRVNIRFKQPEALVPYREYVSELPGAWRVGSFPGMEPVEMQQAYDPKTVVRRWESPLSFRYFTTKESLTRIGEFLTGGGRMREAHWQYPGGVSVGGIREGEYRLVIEVIGVPAGRRVVTHERKLVVP